MVSLLSKIPFLSKTDSFPQISVAALLYSQNCRTLDRLKRREDALDFYLPSMIWRGIIFHSVLTRCIGSYLNRYSGTLSPYQLQLILYQNSEKSVLNVIITNQICIYFSCMWHVLDTYFGCQNMFCKIFHYMVLSAVYRTHENVFIVITLSKLEYHIHTRVDKIYRFL